MFLEVSPHPVVAAAVRDNLTAEAVVVGTLRREEPELATFRLSLAALHCAGVPVAWSVLYGDADLADPPAITYDRRRHWVDVSPASPEPVVAGLPGVHAEVAGDPVRHTWVGDTGLAALPFLADHRVHDEAVLPGAAFHALALSAACTVFGAPADEVRVEDLTFRELLRLADRHRGQHHRHGDRARSRRVRDLRPGRRRRLGPARRRGAALAAAPPCPSRRCRRVTSLATPRRCTRRCARAASSTARCSRG